MSELLHGETALPDDPARRRGVLRWWSGARLTSDAVAATLDGVVVATAVALLVVAAAQDGGRAALNGIVLGLLTMCVVTVTQRAAERHSRYRLRLAVGEVTLLAIALATLPAAMWLTISRTVTTGLVVALAAIVVLATGARAGLLAHRLDRWRRQQVTKVAALSHMALHDSLTGLPNRTLVEDRLAMMLPRQRRAGTELAVVFCDLDRFKQLNDTLGHGGADLVLQVVADRLRAAVRRTDTVSRLQGDEFVILCPDLSGTGELHEVMNRLLRQLSEPMTVAGRPVRVTASLGVALAQSEGPYPTLGELLREADVAMYRAKAHGRNRWERFEPAMAADGDTTNGAAPAALAGPGSPTIRKEGGRLRSPTAWLDPRPFAPSGEPQLVAPTSVE